MWAWVEELDDESAFMLLATSNNQGELSPLEIGLHALKAVPKSQGKRGGGLKEYAAKLGKAAPYLTQLRQAAEVLTNTNLLSQPNKFLSKAQHLCAIHKLPQACWPAACEWLAGSSASVADVEKQVSQAVEFHASWDAEAWAETTRDKSAFKPPAGAPFPMRETSQRIRRNLLNIPNLPRTPNPTGQAEFLTIRFLYTGPA